jgi:hypothetical protein
MYLQMKKNSRFQTSLSENKISNLWILLEGKVVQSLSSIALQVLSCIITAVKLYGLTPFKHHSLPTTDIGIRVWMALNSIFKFGYTFIYYCIILHMMQNTTGQ